jgi:hypothetical protein
MTDKVFVKYNGVYTGVNPATGLTFSPGETRQIPLEQAEILVESGQFEIIPGAGGE